MSSVLSINGKTLVWESAASTLNPSSGTNLVLLSPDVAKVFLTEEAVNEALRSLISLAEKSTGRTSRSTGSSKKRASR
jgi:hypothetical protein